jgi:hypothetical protein
METSIRILVANRPLSREPSRSWRSYLICGPQFVVLTSLEDLGLREFF